MNYLFTYGTLMSGMYNSYVLKRYNSTFIKEATLKNYQLLKSSFPAIRPKKNKEVEGEIYEISNQCLEYLDDMEGITGKTSFNTYKKEIINIDGYDCHVYSLNEDRNMRMQRNRFKICSFNNYKIYHRDYIKNLTK